MHSHSHSHLHTRHRKYIKHKTYKKRKTGNEIRDLKYISWKDPWAWMENMKGKRWENLIKREKYHYNQLVHQHNVEKQSKHMEQEIRDAHQYISLNAFKAGCGTIDIFITPISRFNWKWTWSQKKTPAYDLDVEGDIIWYITSEEDKHFKNLLICEDTTGKKIWTKNAVSSQLAVHNELCYYIKVVDYFRTIELCVCDSRTGRNEKVIFREPDGERDLQLCKTSNKTLYLQSKSPIDSFLYKIDGIKLTRLFKNAIYHMPLGESIYKDECVLTRDSIHEPWKAHGKPIIHWTWPHENIQWVNIQSGNILTIHEGSQTIWHCSRKKPVIIFKIMVGYILPHILSKWENSLMQSFIIKSPFEIPYMIHIINNKIIRDNTIHTIQRPVIFKPLDAHRFHVPSFDGTSIPFITIKQKGIRPKAQLIYVYGAYGSTTPVDWPYENWAPLINRGWIIVYALVRGGGDIDDEWADAARRENRHKSIDDFEAVIRAAQSKHKLSADKTVIFGRSAGGLPVGAIVSRFPDGQLIGAAFTEVPYVDVLRTSSNPELPLTIGEYKEFGNPREKILNFKELLSVSPINSLPNDGANGVFVISRVGLLDKQVYAYESYKWIQRLRGAISPDQSDMSDPKGKYVTFEKNEGHKYNLERFPIFRAIDLAILECWANKLLRF